MVSMPVVRFDAAPFCTSATISLTAVSVEVGDLHGASCGRS